MYDDVKYIVMRDDIDTNEFIGITCYVCFLNKRKSKIKLYSAPSGPRFLYDYMEGKSYIVCYEIRTLSTVRKYKEYVYLLRRRGSHYSVSKLIPTRKNNTNIIENNDDTNVCTKRLVKGAKSK